MSRHQALIRLLRGLSRDELAAFAVYEQGMARDHQKIAAKAQREADAAKKELKRRGGNASGEA